MSARQWGHGYWEGVEACKLRRPTVIGFMHVWHWRHREHWWGNLRRPFRFDDCRPAWVSVTAFGATWFIAGGLKQTQTDGQG